MKISQSELMHHRIQAAMREHDFPEDQIKYIGHKHGHHWYLVAGEHEVKAESIESFDNIEEIDE